MRTGRFLIVLACAALLPSLAAAQDFRFETHASGEQEVPVGIDTDTSAKLVVRFERDLSAARFRLKVFDGRDVLQAHLHCAGAGENGPVVAFLFDASGTNDLGFLGSAMPGDGVNVDGRLSRGVLTNDDIADVDFEDVPECGVVINNIASLRAAMKQHLIYLNVHTIDVRAGEVRGQLDAAKRRGDRDDKRDDDDDD